MMALHRAALRSGSWAPRRGPGACGVFAACGIPVVSRRSAAADHPLRLADVAREGVAVASRSERFRGDPVDGPPELRAVLADENAATGTRRRRGGPAAAAGWRRWLAIR